MLHDRFGISLPDGEQAAFEQWEADVSVRRNASRKAFEARVQACVRYLKHEFDNSHKRVHLDLSASEEKWDETTLKAMADIVEEATRMFGWKVYNVAVMDAGLLPADHVRC